KIACELVLESPGDWFSGALLCIRIVFIATVTCLGGLYGKKLTHIFVKVKIRLIEEAYRIAVSKKIGPFDWNSSKEEEIS
ncbi:MAG: hypothetical protein V3571_06030, partial [Pseudodesulfovibrio sp.]